MPTLETYSPVSAAAEAVGSYLGQKRQNALEEQARQYQQARDVRRDTEADRAYALQQQQFGLEKNRFGLEQQRTASELETAKQQRTFAAANEEFERTMRPLRAEAQRVANKIAQGELLTSQDKHKAAQYELTEARVRAQVAQKYGIPQAALAMQQGRANLAQTQAETGLIGAQTYREMHPITAGRGGGGSRGTSAERASAAYENAFNALSPQGVGFLEMLTGTNNPPTRAQAELALRSAVLSPGDKKNLQTIIESRQMSFISPASEASERRFEQRSQDTATRRVYTDAESRYRDIARGKSYNALSPRLREKIRAALVDSNMTADQALEAVNGSNLPDADKRAIQRALSGG